MYIQPFILKNVLTTIIYLLYLFNIHIIVQGVAQLSKNFQKMHRKCKVLHQCISSWRFKHILWIFKCADYQITYFIFYCLHFRKQTFTSKDIFNFCWILYVRTKGNLSLSLFSFLFCVFTFIIYMILYYLCFFSKSTLFIIRKTQLYFYSFAEQKYWFENTKMFAF